MLNAYLDIQPVVAEALAAGKAGGGPGSPPSSPTACPIRRTWRRRARSSRWCGTTAPCRPPSPFWMAASKVGLDEGRWRRWAGPVMPPPKCSRRDIPFVLANKGWGDHGGLHHDIAAMAGIRVFATGGIGGVHRGAQETFDISATCRNLPRLPVAWFALVPSRSSTSV